MFYNMTAAIYKHSALVHAMKTRLSVICSILMCSGDVDVHKLLELIMNVKA